MKGMAGHHPVSLTTLPRRLIRRQWLLSTLVVLLGMAFLVRLGFWQLDRLEQRRAGNVATAAQLAAAPLTLTADVVLPVDPRTLRNRRVVATGTWAVAEQVIVVQQRYQGQLGNHLLAPLVLADGQTAVLVDRGWVPATVDDPAAWAAYDEAGRVTVEGYAQPPETLPDGRSVVPATPQREWFRRDVPAIAAQLPYTVLPIYIQQAPADDSGVVLPGEPGRVQPDLTLSEGNHFSYAWQWFSFALILAIAYGAYVYRHDSGSDVE